MQLLSSRRARAAVALAAALGLFLTGCTSEDTFSYTPPEQVDAALPDDTIAAMQDAVTNALTASGASGAIVGVWVPWSGSWVTTVGTQEPGGDELSTDMSFRISNETRLMTCDVLYALHDEGTVELDDPVTKYVSGVANLGDVTLLDLCNGTGGIGSSKATATQAILNTPDRVWAPLELASYGLGQSRSAVGTAYRDSDAGFLLLGLALERATHLTASELIAQYVTTPLGLGSTSLPGVTAAAPSTGAVLNGHFLSSVEGGYVCEAPNDITTMSSSSGFTDSGAVSTIEDLGRYAQAEASQALRTEKEPARFGNPLPVTDKAPSWYQATGGALLVGSMIGQQGTTPGYATAAYSDPTTGFTVAVVLNDSTAGSGLVAYLSWELAAIASKAPAASGQTAPEFALPFTAEQYHTAISDAAISCVAPPA